jgi:hypothetical protein
MPLIYDGTNGLTFPDGTLLNTANSVGLHNKLINGGMKVDQRNSGSAQTITAASALAYTVDRWYAYCTGANVTGQRIAGSGSTLNRYQFTGAAATTKIGFGQRIEQANSFDLSGATANLSVDLSNSLLTTVTWVASYANTADTFGSLASPTVTQIATGTFTVTASLARYSVNIAIPAAATTGVQIEFSVGAQVSGTWVVGNAQLEPGTVATPLSQRPIGFELALCQRYFIKYAISHYGDFGNSSGYSILRWTFPVQMRTAPTAVYSQIGVGGVFGGGLEASSLTYADVYSGLGAGYATLAAAGSSFLSEL